MEGGLLLCPDYTPGEVRDLADEFTAVWRLMDLGDASEVRAVVLDTDVECSPVVTVPGIGIVYGVTHAPRSVEIATIDPADGMPLTLRQSALVHEWVHVALWNLTGDPDASHSSGPGPWTPIHDALVTVIRQER